MLPPAAGGIGEAAAAWARAGAGAAPAVCPLYALD